MAPHTRLEAVAKDALKQGVRNLAERQEEDGSWRGHYGGPAFLLPMYVALCQASGHPVAHERAVRMRASLMASVNPDGSIGLYDGGPGCVFTSTLGYVALRVLGMSPDEPQAASLRQWITTHGTPLRSASWGKTVLCTLGLYDYAGLHPLTPELWLLPYALPSHPARMWCHARQVYLPMAWLYGRRAVGESDELIKDLRKELYPCGYDRIDWKRHRSLAASSDSYRPLTLAFRAASAVLSAFERIAPEQLRRRSLNELARHIQFEDAATSHICIGPVNAVLNTLVHHFREPGGREFVLGMSALDEYLWDEDGTTSMQAYNSSQLWDTAFAIQALEAARSAGSEYSPLSTIEAAFGFVRENQLLDDVPDHAQFYRHQSRGGWPFSTRKHGWPITDCTAEGFKAALIGEALSYKQPVSQRRLLEAARLLLSWQNPDGGWATYERTRGGRWLERLNPSQVFGDIMIDYSHIECTSACMQALAEAERRFPSKAEAFQRAITRGKKFLLQRQKEDGSFEGAWGICYTYGTWFGVWGLLSAGVPAAHPRIQRACLFLLSIQQTDGGWGEAPESSSSQRYVPSQGSQAVMTAWALLALIRAGYRDHDATHRGIRYLVERQQNDGSFEREGYTGVFNRTAMLNYDNYRHYFPLWALAEWLKPERRAGR